ncbi:MAG: hypothetical protein AB4290_17055 [Spirulina sp.]
MEWGKCLQVDCLYDPHGDRIPYRLIFQNCEEVRWQIHSPENSGDLAADLIDFQLGKEGQQKPALIYTDIFELSILYGQLEIEEVRDRVPREKLSLF